MFVLTLVFVFTFCLTFIGRFVDVVVVVVVVVVKYIFITKIHTWGIRGHEELVHSTFHK